MPKKQLRIIKIPIQSKDYMNVRKYTFPKQSILYLEYFENKMKVKKNMVNREYQPRADYRPTFDKETKNSDTIKSRKKKKRSFSSSSAESDDDQSGALADRLNELFDDSDEDRSHKRKHHHHHHRKSSSHREPVETKPEEKPEEGEEESESEAEEDNGESDHTPEHQPTKQIPTLSELERQSRDSESEEGKRAELLFKFRILQKKYPQSALPEVSEYSDFDAMKRKYDTAVRELSLDSKVDSYKTYLKYGFMIMEFLMGKVFKLDMNGYTQQQIISMNSYDRLLIELGEKTYMPNGKTLPIELRLLAVIILNTAVFIVGKMLMQRNGTNIFSLLGSNDGGRRGKKHRMKPPSVNLDADSDLKETD